MSSKKKPVVKTGGLFSQITQGKNKHSYTSLPDVEALRDFLMNIPKDAPKPREFMIQVGKAGAEEMNRLMKREAEINFHRGEVDFLYRNLLINSDQYKMIMDGLNSGDEEKYEFSKKLLNAVVHKGNKSTKID